MIKNYLRFGVQRKKDFFEDAKKTYDGIVIPGNILLYQYKATPLVVYKTHKPFFIDPMSYLLGKPFDQFKNTGKRPSSDSLQKFKPSFERLLEGHGLIPTTLQNLSAEQLLGVFIQEEEELKKFVDNAILFQIKKMQRTEEDIKKIDKDLLDIDISLLLPEVIVPPYFTIDYHNYDQIYALSQKILNISRSSKRPGEHKIFPMLHLTKLAIKDEKIRNGIVELINYNEFLGVIIWVDDFSEQRDANEDLINPLIKLIKNISSLEKEVIIMHGGFFSMALSHFGVTHVCHGIGYGESKSGAASAKSGGPPPVRFYIKELHAFLTLEKALDVLKNYDELICNCQACKRVIAGNYHNVTNYFNQEGMADIHFMLARHSEKNQIGNSSLEELIDDLKTMYKTYGAMKDVDLSFLNIWATTLEKNLERN